MISMIMMAPCVQGFSMIRRVNSNRSSVNSIRGSSGASSGVSITVVVDKIDEFLL